jgi:hypothetical protein
MQATGFLYNVAAQHSNLVNSGSSWLCDSEDGVMLSLWKLA